MLQNGNKVQFGNKGHDLVKCLINGGCQCIWSCPRMSCYIWERERDFIMFDGIPLSTIELPEGRFQLFPDISLPEKLTWMSRCSQNTTFIRGASPTQERKVCDMEVKIVTFVVKGSVQLTVPPDRQEKIQVGSRGVALIRVFYLKLSGLHLTKIIFKNLNYWLTIFTSSMYRYVKLNWDANRTFLSSREQILYEFCFVWVQNMSARRGAQLVPVGMPTICWK